MAEQRYIAVLAVLSEGRTVKDVAAGLGISRQTLHTWLARYEAGGLEDLADRSHRPGSCPQQPSALRELVRWGALAWLRLQLAAGSRFRLGVVQRPSGP